MVEVAVRKIEALRIEGLRRMSEEELRRKDTILMTMAQRIPELETARDERGSPEMVSEASGSTSPPEREAADTRSWWRRLFG